MDYGENGRTNIGNRNQTWMRNPREAEQFGITKKILQGARVGEGCRRLAARDMFEIAIPFFQVLPSCDTARS
jgi:hypothetical protein